MFRLSDTLLLLPLSVMIPPFLSYLTGRENVVEPMVIPLSDGFDYPVGWPDAHGYYDAQGFGRNDHLGEDWNGNGGGNTDYGDPVVSIAHGTVSFVGDLGGGWGKVIRVFHIYQDHGEYRRIESFYAHLSEIKVKKGDRVLRGQRLGAIGDADGVYIAHLHFELRDAVGLPHGPGYSAVTDGWISPSDFIQAHRPRAFQ